MFPEMRECWKLYCNGVFKKVYQVLIHLLFLGGVVNDLSSAILLLGVSFYWRNDWKFLPPTIEILQGSPSDNVV